MVVVKLVTLVGRSGGSPVAVADVDIEELEELGADDVEVEDAEDVNVLNIVVV